MTLPEIIPIVGLRWNDVLFLTLASVMLALSAGLYAVFRHNDWL